MYIHYNIKVFRHITGIPFRITCSDDAASPYHNPLQESVLSAMRAILVGIKPADVARNRLLDTYNLFIISLTI